MPNRHLCCQGRKCLLGVNTFEADRGKIRGMKKGSSQPPHFIKEWRKHRGLTQEQLANRVNMSRNNVSKVESFNRPYTQQTLPLFADALGCDPADLLRAPPNPNRPESEFEYYKRILSENQLIQAVEMMRVMFTRKAS